MKDIFVNFKKTGIISVCFLSSLLSGYSQRIVVSPIIPGGGSSGSLTGSYTFTSPISEAAGVVSLPLAVANLNTNYAFTNASSRDFYATNGNLYSKNLSLNHRWVYYDDFNQPMTTPGVFPDSPTGHKYNVFTGGGGNTNKINLVDGKWWLGETGAVYQSVTFGTNGVYGSAAPINTWGGTFSYQRSTNNTPDGYEQNLFLILSPQVDFLPTNYLHITVGANIFRVQRELSATNIIYAQHFGGRYLAFDTNHSFTVTIISNNIICDIAGMRYVGYDESLSTTYGNIKVATWEAIGSPTNQFWGKWDSQYAGYADNEAHWQYAGPFAVRSNGVLSRVTSTNFTLSVDDAYASGWNGSLDVPTKNAVYDKIETLSGGGGGSSGTNFSGLVITNATEYAVLNLGTTTNATLPWGTTNHVVWSPAAANGASLAMSGTAGGAGGTNDQTIEMTLIWPSGATALTLPTNGPNGSPVFVMTGPSTNRLKFRYDGYRFWIASGQQPSTGNGYTAVMQTNATIYLGQYPTNTFLRTGAGGIITTGIIGSGLSISADGTLTASGGSGDITAVGDVTSGGAFDGTAGTTLQFEGSTADGNEVSLTTGDPAADVTVTIPALTGSVPLVIYRSVSVVEITNTVTETAICSYSVPAGTLSTDKSLRVTLRGFMISAGGTYTATMKVKYGATTMYQDVSATTSDTSTRKIPYTIAFDLFGTGSTSAQEVNGTFVLGIASTDPTTGSGRINVDEILGNAAFRGTAAEDSTAAKTLEVSITLSAASTVAWHNTLTKIVYE